MCVYIERERDLGGDKYWKTEEKIRLVCRKENIKGNNI
jgi:hypothetical protein